MSADDQPPQPSQQSGLQIFARIIGLLIVGPAIVLYVISLVVSSSVSP